MRQEQLNAIRKRAEMATSAPWEYDENEHCINAPGFEVVTGVMWYDAEFISRSRQDVPDLLAEVERLTGIVGALISDLKLIEARTTGEANEIAREAIMYGETEVTTGE